MTLKELRESKGLTQVELAKRVDLKQVTICQYENGSRTPNLQTSLKLSDALGVTLDDFVCLLTLEKQIQN